MVFSSPCWFSDLHQPLCCFHPRSYLGFCRPSFSYNGVNEKYTHSIFNETGRPRELLQASATGSYNHDSRYYKASVIMAREVMFVSQPIVFSGIAQEMHPGAVPRLRNGSFAFLLILFSPQVLLDKHGFCHTIYSTALLSHKTRETVKSPPCAFHFSLWILAHFLPVFTPMHPLESHKSISVAFAVDLHLMCSDSLNMCLLSMALGIKNMVVPSWHSCCLLELGSPKTEWKLLASLITGERPSLSFTCVACRKRCCMWLLQGRPAV